MNGAGGLANNQNQIVGSVSLTPVTTEISINPEVKTSTFVKILRA
jgi:hypothetical protein